MNERSTEKAEVTNCFPCTQCGSRVLVVEATLAKTEYSVIHFFSTLYKQVVRRTIRIYLTN